ncbi:MAG: hypothetical protein ACFFF4_08645 [Candidatus Thorarchaeota archaeon]
METRPRKLDEGIATCMLCGAPLKGRVKVRYQGWWCHIECAAENQDKNVVTFNKTPFYLGSLGAPIGILLTLSMIYMSVQLLPLYSVWPIAIPFLGMALGLAFQSIGFYGFYSRYYQPMGIALAILAISTAVFHAVTGIILVQNGFNPAYYDQITGEFIPLLIPGLWFYMLLSYLSLGFLMIITAVEVLMLEGIIGSGVYNRIIAVVFVVLVAAVPATPINIVIELSAITILFLSAGVPKSWRGIPSAE